MRKHQAAGAMIGVVLGCSISLASPASACGYHATLGSGFSPLHPASISVAMALREAIDGGAVRPIQPHPSLIAFAQAGRRLDQVRRALAAVMDAEQQLPPMALLLVEPGLWARYHADAGQLVVEMHASGPKPGDVVVVTGEAVLQALIDQRISLDRAIRSGLVVLDGHQGATGLAVEALHHLATGTRRLR